MNQKQLMEEIEIKRRNNIIRIGEVELQLLEIKKLENKIKEKEKNIKQLSINNVDSNCVISELKMHLRNTIK